MIVKINNTELVNYDYKIYLLKKIYFRYLLDNDLIELEEYEKSIVQIIKKYNGKV